MNIAAKEFIETGIDWASAALSRLAKEHGEPEKLIADIYENGYLDGYRDAIKGEKIKQYGIIGVGLTGVVALCGVTYHFYKQSKNKQKELEWQLQENARLKSEKFASEILSEENKVLDRTDNVVTVDFKRGA